MLSGYLANAAITFDLQAKSMRHGKKGFERLLWAAKNVLNDNKTWLFHDPNVQGRSESIEAGEKDAGASSKQPLLKHHPLQRETTLKMLLLKDTLIPPIAPPWTSVMMDPSPSRHFHQRQLSASLLEMHEYISLLSLRAPRISSNDECDSVLSRYSIPDRSSVKVGDIMVLQWEGFLVAHWIRSIFVAITKAINKAGGWMAMSAYPYEGAGNGMGGYTILMTEDHTEGGEVRNEMQHDDDMERNGDAYAKGRLERGEGSSVVEHVGRGESGERAQKRRKKVEQRGGTFVLWEYDKGGLGLGT